MNITYHAPSQLLTVHSLLCVAQQGPHVLVFQVHGLLSLKLQWPRLRRLHRRPPVRWLQPSLRRLCQLHNLSLRRSLRLVQLCRRIFYACLKLARFAHLPGSSGISIVSSCLTSNGRSTSTSTRTNVKFSLGELPQPLSVQAPSMGPYVGSSSNPPLVPQWPATTPGFQSYSASFSPKQTPQVIIPGTPSLFTSNYSVAGPGNVLPASFAPGYLSSASASAFPAANFPPPPLLWVRASPRRSQDSCCDNLSWKTTSRLNLRVLHSLPTSSSFGRPNGAERLRTFFLGCKHSQFIRSL